MAICPQFCRSMHIIGRHNKIIFRAAVAEVAAAAHIQLCQTLACIQQHAAQEHGYEIESSELNANASENENASSSASTSFANAATANNNEQYLVRSGIEATLPGHIGTIVPIMFQVDKDGQILTQL